MRPRLADFGQSRMSHEQTPSLGTLFYMAPEQADLNAVPDARWDVYALGAILYCMLCGFPLIEHLKWSTRWIRRHPCPIDSNAIEKPSSSRLLRSNITACEAWIESSPRSSIVVCPKTRGPTANVQQVLSRSRNDRSPALESRSCSWVLLDRSSPQRHGVFLVARAICRSNRIGG